jgi:site-specific DNA-methyltransferase (adenine-specific)
MRLKSGLSMHELTAKIGAHGKVNHGGAVSNWEAGRNTPSREQYNKICRAIIDTGKVDFMPAYEDTIRIFSIDGTKEFTDVWTFPSVRPYKGKHPAEKPAAMLEHAIEATTFPGDVVLDCFAGSGSTALAALNLGRRTIAIEIEPSWAAQIASRVKSYCEDAILLPSIHINQTLPNPKKHDEFQSSLFSAVM